jgi:hypothetical protein
MKHKFSWLVGLLSLFLFSGQAFAAALSSVAAGGTWATAATWNTAACGTANVVAAPTNADDVTICAATTTAVTTGAAAVAKSLTFVEGGKFTQGAFTLTLSGNLTNNSVTTANVDFTTNGTGVIFDATASVGGTAATTFKNLTTSAALTLAANTTITGNLTVSTGGSIALASTNVVTGNVTLTGTGTISGTLGLTNADHAIATDADINLTGITLTPATAAKTITFSPAGGKTITVGTISNGSSSTGLNLACNGAGSATTVATSGTVTSYTCIGLTTPAPVFSTKEKAKVFVEEVNH